MFRVSKDTLMDKTGQAKTTYQLFLSEEDEVANDDDDLADQRYPEGPFS